MYTEEEQEESGGRELRNLLAMARSIALKRFATTQS